MAESDKVFAGSIPQLYEEYLVPLIFVPYADDLAARLARRPVSRVLEVAAGTGVATRALSTALPAGTAIVATDLNPAMIEKARERGTKHPVEWRQADAMALPFGDGEFDAVVCQFGAMFFPDRPRAFSEMLRVLRPGGVFLFNAWDHISHNEFADEVTNALAGVFPADPPRFMARIPHGYHDRDAIERDISAGGFRNRPRTETIAERSRAASHRHPAIAYCQGTPLRSEIEARGPGRLAEATEIAAEAVAARFGRGAVDAKIQAHVFEVEA